MNEYEIFSAAIKLVGERRQAFLAAACDADDLLREQVEALLRAHDESGDFELEKAAARPDVTKSMAAESPPGTLIAGRYKLIEAIGEGGMGSVWLAEQKEPVKRKVAVKLIKPGMDSKSVLARFEAERQALALMDHPNIAKVFDGGMTDQGRPFFVMEFVKGVPFTEYCDQARLSLKERLALFTPVCQAVQHAHQKGIIHRDLKPSNILICLYDGKPVPKVIDFGLAKAMHQSLTEQSLYTAVGMMVGTPLYMSPEQAEHNNLDVDTRTDIYSLGVILYELLTGSTPLERPQLKDAAYNEILRLIKEFDPPKPSTRMSGSASLPSVAAQRSIEPRQLSKSLAGDLDWIVMKALDKERSRRYETANGLARDIERYLNDEAVEACPPSAAYRFKKLLRRNKGRFIAASLVLLALVAGTAAVVAVQARANKNLRLVNSQLDQANSELKSSNALLDQQRARAVEREQQAIDAVKRFRDAVADNDALKNNPALDSLRKTLLKEPLEFFKTLREQLQADKDTRPEALARLARSAYELGRLTSEIGDKQDSLRAFQEALEIQERLVRENPTITEFQNALVNSHISIGARLSETGEPEKGLTAYEKTLAIQEQLVEANPTFTEYQSRLAATHNDIGLVLRQTGDPVKALVAYEKALAISERIVQANPTATRFQSRLASCHNNIGALLCETGEPVKGLMAFENALEIRVRLAQTNPTVTEFQSQLAESQHNIGTQHEEAGAPAKALASHEKALEIRARLAQTNPTVTRFQENLALSHSQIGSLLSQTGEPTKALAAYEKAIMILEQLVQSNPTVTEFQSQLAMSHYNVGNLFSQTGEPAKALAEHEKALEIRRRLVQANLKVMQFQSDLGAILNNIAGIEVESARFDDARIHLLEAIKWQKQALAANPMNPTFRQYLKYHYIGLLETANGLLDNNLGLEAQRGLAELVASDPAFRETDDRINEIVAGADAESFEELLFIAQRCYDTRRFVLAVTFWNQALEAQPKLADDRETQHRYNAACAASLAAAGQGQDEPPLDDDAQAKFRKQALDWLTAELATWSTLLESGPPETRTFVVQTLKHWQQDSDLAGIRDASELTKLPDSERSDWEKLWKRVEELLAKA